MEESVKIATNSNLNLEKLLERLINILKGLRGINIIEDKIYNSKIHMKQVVTFIIGILLQKIYVKNISQGYKL